MQSVYIGFLNIRKCDGARILTEVTEFKKSRREGNNQNQVEFDTDYCLLIYF